jgi:hypothetical protein
MPSVGLCLPAEAAVTIVAADAAGSVGHGTAFMIMRW